LPLGYVFLSENLPLKNRNTTLIMLGIFYAIGPLIGCLLAKYCLKNDFESGNWNYLSAFAFIPSSIFLIFSLIFL
jgi:MFS family permease